MMPAAARIEWKAPRGKRGLAAIAGSAAQKFKKKSNRASVFIYLFLWKERWYANRKNDTTCQEARPYIVAYHSLLLGGLKKADSSYQAILIIE
jgi:hypothetical protein